MGVPWTKSLLYCMLQTEEKNYIPTFYIGRYYYILMCFECQHMGITLNLAPPILRGLLITDMNCKGKQVLSYTDIVQYIHHLTDKMSPGLGIKST